MKLFSIFLLVAPGCLSRRLPQNGHIAPAEPHPRFEPRELSLTSLNGSIAGVDRTFAVGSSAVDPPADPPIGSPEFYQQQVNQGCTLFGMMSTRDAVAARFIRPENTRTTAASPWTDYSAFKDWGWEIDWETVNKWESDMLQDSFQPAMQTLGLPDVMTVTEGGSAKARIWWHKHDTTHDGILYRVSDIPYWSISQG